jgi:hypothetical protein
MIIKTRERVGKNNKGKKIVVDTKEGKTKGE